jgi:glycosyltransferase involved in cell wall biosynthesis
MIVVCELSFLGRAHVPFNAGLLATIHACFPKEDIWFYGSRTHIEELKKEVSQSLASLVIWTQIDPPSSNATYLRRFVSELKIFLSLLGILAANWNSRLVLTSAYPSTVLALKVARCFRARHRPIQIVLHGLSGLVGKRTRRPIARLQDMRTALTLFGNRRIHYIVLEQPICDTILENFPLLVGKVDALEHPLSPSKQTELPSINLTEPMRFGFLGLADKAKGFPLFVEIAHYFAARYGKRVEFHAIGHSPGNDIPANGTQALATKPQSALMSRTAFVNAVVPLHFIVLPHEPVAYTLTASGVLLDAIAWGKPVIARKIPIFESMFRKHGDIGYLFSNKEELKDVLERILQDADNSLYQQQVFNIRNARKSRDPETLAEVYSVISSKAGY